MWSEEGFTDGSLRTGELQGIIKRLASVYQHRSPDQCGLNTEDMQKHAFRSRLRKIIATRLRNKPLNNLQALTGYHDVPPHL